MKNIQVRSGDVKVRVGGNTQEKAVFFPDGLPGGETILKDNSDVHGIVSLPFFINKRLPKSTTLFFCCCTDRYTDH